MIRSILIHDKIPHEGVTLFLLKVAINTNNSQYAIQQCKFITLQTRGAFCYGVRKNKLHEARSDAKAKMDETVHIIN